MFTGKNESSEVKHEEFWWMMIGRGARWRLVDFDIRRGMCVWRKCLDPRFLSVGFLMTLDAGLMIIELTLLGS